MVHLGPRLIRLLRSRDRALHRRVILHGHWVLVNGVVRVVPQRWKHRAASTHLTQLPLHGFVAGQGLPDLPNVLLMLEVIGKLVCHFSHGDGTLAVEEPLGEGLVLALDPLILLPSERDVEGLRADGAVAAV